MATASKAKGKGAQARKGKAKGSAPKGLQVVTWQRGLRAPHVIAVHYLHGSTAPLTLCRGLHTTASPYLGTGGHKVVATPSAKVTCQRCIAARARMAK